MAEENNKIPTKAFNTAWNGKLRNFVFEEDYSSKSQLLVELWKSLEKEIVLFPDRSYCAQISDLIRLTKRHTIEKDWSYSSECKMIMSTITSLSGSVKRSQLKELTHLREFIVSPWKSPTIMKLMGGKGTELSMEQVVRYLSLEGLEVCKRRLEILLDFRYLKVVFNLSGAVVKVLSSHKFKESFPSEVADIIVIWVTVAFQLKSTEELYSIMHKFPKTVVHEVLNRFHGKSRINDECRYGEFYKLIYTDLLVYCMDDLFVCGKGDGDNVIRLWLEEFKENSDKVIREATQYLRRSTNSKLLYSLGSQMYEKLGKSSLEISLSCTITGIIADLNRLKKSVDSETEKKLSNAFILLSKFLPENLTFVRECVLTAFSIYPSHELMSELSSLAEKSGFSHSSGREEKDDDNIKKLTFDDCFENVCEKFIESLKSNNFNRAQPHPFRSGHIKKLRNLDGLLLIQGELLTHSSNYKPSAMPVTSLSAQSLGISEKLTSDLLVAINSPRWHVLSWVMDWPKLEEQCLHLLKDPSIKRSIKELKYLVIDYTQFDDWSSDEEITLGSGIEKGYEEWDYVNFREDLDQVVENGLYDEDNEEEIEFNVIPVIPDEEPKAKRAKLAEPEIKEKLKEVVPGLDKRDLSLLAPVSPISMEVRIVQIWSTSASSHNNIQVTVDSLANSLISQIQSPVATLENEEKIKLSSPPPSLPLRQNSQIDLIRQLNLARSQGLVILQQWGDKQVLVHKATGRWIMRQGNRLVTVPPQALGINTAVSAEGSTSTDNSSAALPQLPANANSTSSIIDSAAVVTSISSINSIVSQQDSSNDDVQMSPNTMEQLAEFDSILESKFKATVRSSSKESGPLTYLVLSPTTPMTRTNFISNRKISSDDNNNNDSKVITTSNIESFCERPLRINKISSIFPTSKRDIQAKDSNVLVKSNQTKPHEDSVTLKRIQQILDDYNEQIRKSPDLQTRPAPRRRASATICSHDLAPGNQKNDQQPKKRRISNDLSTSSKIPQITEAEGASNNESAVIVPSSLQESEKQLIFVDSNKKIVAFKPLILQNSKGLKSSGQTLFIHDKSNTQILLTPPQRTTTPPGLGIPMEMTAGQIMEAEISADISDCQYFPTFCRSSKSISTDKSCGKQRK